MKVRQGERGRGKDGRMEGVCVCVCEDFSFLIAYWTR